MAARTRLAAAKALQAAAKPTPLPPATATATTTATPPIQLFEDASAWEAWLEANHNTVPTGLWLKISKKASGIASVTYDEALDAALCFGWIDGQRKTHDAQHFIQRFTPRRARSMWSKRNVDKVAVLVERGRMRPAGLVQVEEAKRDGRWERAYSGSSVMEVPEDFRVALERDVKAKAFFEGLGKTKRYSFLWRIASVKREETRRKKIAQFVGLLAEGKTL